jgi:ubiquinone/menaquinone biosynthesis C-methylase UbiE
MFTTLKPNSEAALDRKRDRTADREQVTQEIARVLKPGGQLGIPDIRHTGQYERALQYLGWAGLQRCFPNFLFVTPTPVLRGTKP